MWFADLGISIAIIRGAISPQHQGGIIGIRIIAPHITTYAPLSRMLPLTRLRLGFHVGLSRLSILFGDKAYSPP